MIETPENPPAFPRTGEGLGNPRYDVPGMTLRDWFAGQALAIVFRRFQVGSDPSQDDLAVQAYAIADAMLEERAK